ncbi:MAG: TlpA family protein disulfide reductase [Deltaproteobacteria bacterium]|nr:TlpA family protein disulfide reductase [Deltaproteobacteria bacterium]
MKTQHLSAWILIALLAGCAPQDGPKGASVPEDKDDAVSLEGDWRAVLASPGGDLPFTLRVGLGEAGLSAVAITGEEEIPLSSVEYEGDNITFHFDWYDSEITAEVLGNGSLAGSWRKTIPQGNSTLPFTATRAVTSSGASTPRFQPMPVAGLSPGDEAGTDDVSGVWQVVFADSDGEEPARGEFRQQGDRVEGTFLTPTGDYRFLEGSFETGLLRLSTFDGAHAFLFHARAQADGTLEGDFWSRDSYHATWTARRAKDEEAPLPDAWSLARLTNEEGRFSFDFPDLDGHRLSLADPRFDGKVVLVNIFGSWCPNCNDEAPLLAKWHRQYKEQGLEVVGLAYEFSGDPKRDGTVVKRFAERYGIEYPLLLAGVSDKAKAAETLPDLSAVIAFPTSIFIDREGRVRRIHSGFSGPGTGDHYHRLVAELEELLEDLLQEPSSTAG